MSNMFKHTPLAAEARITALERELAALKAASREMLDAYNDYKSHLDWGVPSDMDSYESALNRYRQAKAALKALLAEGETDGS